MTQAALEATKEVADQTAAPALRRTVQKPAKVDENVSAVGVLTMQLASVADDIMPWGRAPVLRDKKLREFWPTETVLASAIFSIAARNAAFSWTLDGPPRTSQAVQEMLHAANLGRGWLDFAVKISVDLATQDNGAFVEVIRGGDAPTAPVVGINHLDAERCRRTGDPEVPVVYRDRQGYLHKLKWYQVIPLAEMPSPVETMNGMQYCAVTRVLRAAQVLRDIAIYKREKIGGRGPASIHLVSGVGQTRIDDEMKKSDEKADNQGLLRYIMPTILASLDPNAEVSHVEIPIKSLPDGFDEDVVMRWYIAQLALGFGADYQDFAPLPGNGLGQGQQSEMLHKKSQGKGPGFFMKMLEHSFNFHGVMPRSVTFRFDEQDTAADLEKTDLRKTRGELFALYMNDLDMPAPVVYQMMADEGDITEEQLDMLGQQDVTDDVVLEDAEDYQEPVDVQPLLAAAAQFTGLKAKATPALRNKILRELRTARKLRARAQRKKGKREDGLPADLGHLVDELTDELKQATSDLDLGELDLNAWHAEVTQLLIRYHTAAYITGTDADSLGRKDAGALAKLVKTQLDFLKDFKVEIQRADEFEAGWKARAASYAQGIKTPYWKGKTKLLPLPAMPGEGSQCLTNCNCKWDVKALSSEAGDYDAFWVLEPGSEHCQTCVERAKQWAPLEIRGGVLVQ